MAFERAIIAIACVLSVAGTPAAAQSPSDEQAIQRLASQFERAWNTHDMTLLGDMVTDDVDFVNVVGMHWTGRRQVVDSHVAIHRDRFKNSVWANERVTVQFVRPDVALARVEWNTRGDLTGPADALKPGPPRRGLFLWVVVKEAGSWRIRAVQNTERQ
jgi:uncharacterized protein (TIGR02246 family)